MIEANGKFPFCDAARSVDSDLNGRCVLNLDVKWDTANGVAYGTKDVSHWQMGVSWFVLYFGILTEAHEVMRNDSGKEIW